MARLDRDVPNLKLIQGGKKSTYSRIEILLYVNLILTIGLYYLLLTGR